MSQKTIVRKSVTIPTKYGAAELISFTNLSDGKEHFAFALGDWRNKEVTNIRLHSECVTGEILGSAKCDCGEQLDEALNLFSVTGGIVFYLKQEGRGIGLYNKIDAYALQNLGYDTVEANNALNFEDDLRDYAVAGEMLSALSISKVNLLTNNSNKIKAVESMGIEVVKRIPTSLFLKAENLNYLQVKAQKSGHMLILNTQNFITANA
jgi:GTP cyclohydrolase II